MPEDVERAKRAHEEAQRAIQEAEEQNARRRAEEQRQREEAEQRRIAEQQAREAAFLAENADLIKAWNYHSRKDRERDKAIAYWESYLNKHPNSPFAGEVYYRIGTLYSTHRNKARGESYSMKTAEQWYQKALPHFEGKYSSASNIIWQTLCNYPTNNRNLEYKKKYYDWLLNLRANGEAEHVFPYKRIANFLRSRQPELTDEERAWFMTHEKQQIRDIVLPVARANILQRASISDLNDLAQTYPNDELGRLAKARLVKYETESVDQVIGDAMSSDLLETPDVAAVKETGELTPPASIGPSAATVATAADRAAESRFTRNMPIKWLALGGAATLVLAVCGLVLVQRRKAA